MEAFSLLEIVGALIGLLYVILEYRASVWLWPVGVVMPAIYIYIYHQAGIYADMGINIYFLVAAIYGWIVWHRAKVRSAASHSSSNGAASEAGDQMSGVEHATLVEWIWCSLTLLVSFLLLSYILLNFTSSTVPFSDSFTTALSIVGMWMLAHKRLEHWILWVVVNGVSVAIYIEKGLYPTSALYALYTVVAVAGYVKWFKMMRNDAAIRRRKAARSKQQHNCADNC